MDEVTCGAVRRRAIAVGIREAERDWMWPAAGVAGNNGSNRPGVGGKTKPQTRACSGRQRSRPASPSAAQESGS